MEGERVYAKGLNEMKVLELGVLFDLPVLMIILVGMVAFRRYARAIVSKPYPVRIVVFLTLAAIVISVEENINCGQFDCQTTIWPPTANFLLGLTIVLGIAALALKTKRVGLYILFSSVLGLVYEVFAGGSSAAFLALEPFWFFIISLLTVVSYGVIFYLPFTVLLTPKSSVEENT